MQDYYSMQKGCVTPCIESYLYRLLAIKLIQNQRLASSTVIAPIAGPYETRAVGVQFTPMHGPSFGLTAQRPRDT